MSADASFDVIVVGAGSAGCALAARLSEDSGRRVLLLEAGPRDWNPIFHIPLASGKALRDGWYGWGFTSEPEASLAGRALPLPRGRVLGGSSSINGMVYIRGHRDDFDEWAAAGNPGWSYREVLPLFKRSEGHLSRDDEFHGRDGPLGVSTARGSSPVFDAFVEAGTQAGFARNSDFNGREMLGFGRFDFTIAHGRRSSASVAFLRRARRRPHLAVMTGAEVLRVRLQGDRAVGVDVGRGRSVSTLHAGEVVVCAGSIKSPHLLMLSGIGEPRALAAAGVTPRHALPGVGQNLLDHMHAPLLLACPKPVTAHALIRADRIALAMARAVLWRDGPATSFPTEAGGFTRVDENGAGAPDLQFHLVNALGLARVRWPGQRGGALEQEGFTLSVCLLKPRSAGQLRLVADDPRTPPRIHLNWLADERDVSTMLAGLDQARRIAAQPALAPYISAAINHAELGRSRDGDLQWLRRHCGSVHHQVGTCRMGRGEDAVVDARLRVHGIRQLRVADASIMPTLVRGNTNAAAIMIGEKAAEMMIRET